MPIDQRQRDKNTTNKIKDAVERGRAHAVEARDPQPPAGTTMRYGYGKGYNSGVKESLSHSLREHELPYWDKK